jgi:hypothetical protein
LGTRKPHAGWRSVFDVKRQQASTLLGYSEAAHNGVGDKEGSPRECIPLRRNAAQRGVRKWVISGSRLRTLEMTLMTQRERRSKSSDNRSEQFADTGGESHR